MAEPSSPMSSTAWPGLLPPGAVAEWKKVDENAPAILLEQIAKDAVHVRRMAWARLILAVLLFAGSLALSTYLIHSQQILGGVVSAGAGTMTVVTILLTGKPPVPRRK
ncbi:hypothetical protein AB0F81_38865 [Actinoplanes sp. NPDC024001]|uniref:hypothetical protein n=1 Tax=Actinoplanes sp. NPDC024001 TaxID=3154598 RepID=UPI0033C79919